jgi:hypothetical protein
MNQREYDTYVLMVYACMGSITIMATRVMKIYNQNMSVRVTSHLHQEKLSGIVKDQCWYTMIKLKRPPPLIDFCTPPQSSKYCGNFVVSFFRWFTPWENLVTGGQVKSKFGQVKCCLLLPDGQPDLKRNVEAWQTEGSAVLTTRDLDISRSL